MCSIQYHSLLNSYYNWFFIWFNGVISDFKMMMDIDRFFIWFHYDDPMLIQLTDVNNKSPRFTKPTFVHHVDEVTPVGSQVMRLQYHRQAIEHVRLITCNSCCCCCCCRCRRKVLQLEAHDADSNPQLRFQLGDTLETRNKGGHRTNHQSERYFT